MKKLLFFFSIFFFSLINLAKNDEIKILYNLENEIKCSCCVNNNNNGNTRIGTLKFHRFRSYQNNKKYRICLDADGEYPILIATYKCTKCQHVITSTSDNLTRFIYSRSVKHRLYISKCYILVRIIVFISGGSFSSF